MIRKDSVLRYHRSYHHAPAMLMIVYRLRRPAQQKRSAVKISPVMKRSHARAGASIRGQQNAEGARQHKVTRKLKGRGRTISRYAIVSPEIVVVPVTHSESARTLGRSVTTGARAHAEDFRAERIGARGPSEVDAESRRSLVAHSRSSSSRKAVHYYTGNIAMRCPRVLLGPVGK